MKSGPGYCVLEIKLTLPEEYAAEATEAIRAKVKEWNLAEPLITQTVVDSPDIRPSAEIRTLPPQ